MHSKFMVLAYMWDQEQVCSEIGGTNGNCEAAAYKKAKVSGVLFFFGGGGDMPEHVEVLGQRMNPSHCSNPLCHKEFFTSLVDVIGL